MNFLKFFSLLFFLLASSLTTFGLNLSKQESAWIKKHPVVRLGVPVDFEPFAYRSVNSAEGFSVDYIKLLATRAGIKLEFVLNDWNNLIEMAKSKKIDIMTPIILTPEREKYLLFSNPYRIMTEVIIVNNKVKDISCVEDFAGRNIALVKNTMNVEFLESQVPQAKIITKIHNLGALKSVAMGQSAAILADLCTAEFIIQKNGLANLEIAAESNLNKGSEPGYRFAIRKDWPLLLSILEKAEDKIPSKKITDLEKHWFPLTKNNTKSLIELTPKEQAWIAAHPIIKAGAPNYYPPFGIFKNGKGEGFCYDYLELIARKLGLKIEFTEGNLNSFAAQVKSGQADIWSLFTKKQKDPDHFRLTKSYFAATDGFFIQTGNKEISTLEDFNGKKIAMVKGVLIEPLKSQVPNIEFVFFDTAEEALKAVAFGQADITKFDLATASYYIRESGLRNLTAILVGDVSNYKMIVNKDNPILQQILNKAIDSVSISEISTLENRWFPVTKLPVKLKKITLTPSEQQWLKDHSVVTLGVDPDFAPFEFVDDSGNYSGIASDYLKLIEKVLDIRFEPVKNLLWKESIEMIKAEKLDALPCVGISDERKQFLIFSNPYLIFSRLIITQTNSIINSLEDLDGVSVGVQENSAHHDFIKEKTKINPVLFNSFEDALEAVATGKVFAAIGNLAVSASTPEQTGFDNLKIACRIHPASLPLAFAVRKDLAPLIPILNKVFKSIPYQEKIAIIERWVPAEFAHEVHYGFSPANPLKLTDEELAWIYSNPVVKLGIDKNWPPFEWIDENGNYTGLSSDYIALITELTGLKFEFDENLNWSKTLIGLTSGSIDIAPAMTVTEDRKRFLDFTQSYISFPAVITVVKGHGRSGGLEAYSDLKIGTSWGYVFHEFIQHNYPEINLTLFDNSEKGLEALAVGKIDAYVGNLAVLNYIMRKNSLSNLEFAEIINDMAKNELSFGVKKDAPLLISILDKALDSIPQKTHQELAKKWIGIDSFNQLASPSLTDLEKKWLKQHPVIKARWGDHPPYHFWQNEATGISVDLLNRIGELFGFEIEYIHNLNWTEALKTFDKHENADLLLTIARTLKREKYINFSQPYIKTPRAIFMHKDAALISGIDDLKGKTVAVPKSYKEQQILTENYPDIKLLLVNSSAEALTAVNQKKADAYIGLSTVAKYQMEKLKLSKVKFAAPSGFSNKSQSFGVRKDWPILVSILNKGLRSISTEEHAAINYKYYSFPAKKLNYTILFIIAGGVLLIILTILIWNYMLRKKVAENTNEIRRYSHHLEEIVSERTKELQATTERYTSMFENMPTGFAEHEAILDEDGNLYDYNYININPAFTEETGFQREAIIGKTLRDIFPDINPNWIKSYEPVALHGKPISLEKYSQELDKYFEIKAISPKKHNFVVFFYDITDRKRGEEALRKNEAAMAVAQRIAQLGSWDWDLINNIIIWSEEAKKIYNFDPNLDSYSIDNFFEVVHPDDLTLVQNSFDKVIEDGESNLVEHRIVFKNGEIRTILLQCEATRDSNNKVVRINVIIKDITEKNLMAQAKANFLANMSHEIRTPLNAVLGLGYLMHQTSLSPKQEEYLDKMQTSTELLLRIVNDILDFSKMDAGKLELESTEFTIEDLLGNVDDICAEFAKQKKLALTFNCNATDKIVFLGDSLRISQILNNLVNNAIKFTQEGTISVDSNIISKDDSKAVIEFVVKDTGIGITEEQRQKLFLSFTQADSSTTRKYGGTGLGLSISKRLVEMMGGEINLKSSNNQGTTFSFFIPLKIKKSQVNLSYHNVNKYLDTSFPETYPNTSSAESMPNLSHSIDGANILLVEDNEINQDVAKEFLDLFNVNVTLANNGLEALKILESDDFDVVLMDIQMPIMDGFEATRQIRANPRCKNLPIIAMTANVMSSDIQEALSAGMNAHIGKPINPTELQKTIAKYIHPMPEANISSSKPSSPLTAPSCLEDITGLDLESGLNFMGGSQILYQKILVKFTNNQKNVVADIRKALATNDYETATRLAHSLKGLAGTIGAFKLQEVAKFTEIALRKNDIDNIDSGIEQIKNTIEPLIKNILAVLT